MPPRRTPGRNQPPTSSPPPRTPGEAESGRISPPPPPFTTDNDAPYGEYEDEEGVIDEVAELRGDDDMGEDEGEGEELIGEDMEADYGVHDSQDSYNAEEFDEQQFAPLTAEERMAAEEQMDRDKRSRSLKIPAALYEEDEEEEEGRRVKYRRLEAERAAEEVEEDINLENFHGPLKGWITTEATRRVIKRQLAEFLKTFVTEDERGSERYVYQEKIIAMGRENRSSLEVSYVHMSNSVTLLAVWLVDEPKEMLKIFDEVSTEVTGEIYEHYARIQQEIHTRITDLPIVDTIRDLRHEHLGGLVRVSGVVTRRSEIFPHMKYVRYDCGKCGFVVGPFVQNRNEKIVVGSCPQCESRGPYSVNHEQTIYSSYQRMTLQESPGSVPAGRVPRTMDVALLNDTIDSVRPGEEVDITGIYTHTFERNLNVKFGFPAFATLLEANYIERKGAGTKSFRLTTEDLREVEKLATDPNIQERLIETFAPSIYGHKDVKTALTLSLFGGVRKDVHGKQQIRGDINILMVGDPGTAKSQFLKYVTSTAYRAVFSTGQGASAVGLTASVHKDPMTGSWTLEGGAMVLADEGVCVIDEFDKMDDKDRVSIHEAMEQQSISVSKAGIVTTLQARCAVIAAANPIHGRYEPASGLMDNVDLSEPILSRFDVVSIMRDEADPVLDLRLAKHVTKTHHDSHPSILPTAERAEATTDADVRVTESGITTIRQDLFRKYIRHAKTLDVSLPKERKDRLQKLPSFYAQLRQRGHEGGIVVTVRLIESMIRLAEASARMHLRTVVIDRDVDMAIEVVMKSFIASQKYTRRRPLQDELRRFVSDRRDNDGLLLDILEKLMKDIALQHTYAGVMSSQGTSSIRVSFEEFSGKVPDRLKRELRDFFRSERFTMSAYEYVEADEEIVLKRM